MPSGAAEHTAITFYSLCSCFHCLPSPLALISLHGSAFTPPSSSHEHEPFLPLHSRFFPGPQPAHSRLGAPCQSSHILCFVYIVKFLIVIKYTEFTTSTLWRRAAQEGTCTGTQPPAFHLQTAQHCLLPLPAPATTISSH